MRRRSTQPAPRRGSALGLILVLAVLAGCGGDDDDSGAESGGKEVDAFVFKRAFEKEAGVKLQTKDIHVWWTGLDAGGDDTAFREYGTFTVWVVDDDEGLEAKTTGDSGEPLERGEGGVYWWRSTGFRGYMAVKRFGDNVVVHWSAGKAKRTDDRWDRLAAATQKAVDTAGS